MFRALLLYVVFVTVCLMLVFNERSGLLRLSCIGGLEIFLGFFFFKQKTAYEVRISDWSSDVCSSDLGAESTNTRWPNGPTSSAMRSASFCRSEERRVGKECVIRVDLGGRRIIKKKKHKRLSIRRAKKSTSVHTPKT